MGDPIKLDPAAVQEQMASLAWQQHQDMLLNIAQLTVYVRQLETENAALRALSGQNSDTSTGSGDSRP